MAKIKVMGNIISIELGVTAKDMNKIQDCTPTASKLIDKDGNELFSVQYGNTGSIGKYGVVFSNVTEENYPVLTFDAPCSYNTERTKEYIKNNLVGPLHKLSLVEANLVAALGQINDVTAHILENIEEV